jgi:shikimate dehydrogenase
VSSLAVQPIVALLSNSVGGNPTQYTIEKAFAHHQLDWRFLTVEVSPEDLGDAVRGIRAMGFRGAYCGNPHKQAVAHLLDRTTTTAGLAGVVNLIFREDGALVGENTEGKGLLRSLGRLREPAGMQVVLLGAGRVARAIGIELAAAWAARVTVVNRSGLHTAELVALLTEELSAPAAAAAWEGDYVLPEGTDLLINATSIGQSDPDARVPLNLDTLSPQTIVADVTINPPQTWLLREAAQRGCTTLDGLAMYIDQLAIGFRLWTGVDPDHDVMREAIEEFLEL